MQIFFDLDHTLWDFDRNSRDTLVDLLREYEPRIGQPVDFDTFFPHFRYIHKKLWQLFQQEQIAAQDIRARRFRFAFGEMGIDHEAWVDEFGLAYIEQCPLRPHLIDGARELLDHLRKKHPLHLITNGFAAAQTRKVQHSGLNGYFASMTTSESVGVKKPRPEIFEYALQQAGCLPEDAIYIGDDYEVDIIGASMVGMNTIWFNPERLVNPYKFAEVTSLREVEGMID